MISGQTAGAIVASVRDAIAHGELRMGDSLPPIRELAATLGVNRNTIATAYRQLVSAGVAESRGRGGTVISSRLLDPTEIAAPADTVDLASGNPDPAFLPDLRSALAAADYHLTLYGTPAVAPGLLDAASRLFDDHPITGELAVTHGAIDAIERILNTHLVRGDAVAVENPGFLASIGTVRLNGYRPSPSTSTLKAWRSRNWRRRFVTELAL